MQYGFIGCGNMGGAVARAAREDLEKQTGTSVVTSKNAKNLRGLE